MRTEIIKRAFKSKEIGFYSFLKKVHDFQVLNNIYTNVLVKYGRIGTSNGSERCLI